MGERASQFVCSSCGATNAAAAKFCSECGRRLQDSPQVEERKVVSVVFCDLVGSTARAESLDPEDVRSQLSAFHSRVRAELERHGGTVEKFIGDAVVAVFGAPLVREDDAERAVRAALAIRDWAVEERDVEVRLAVNTGEALVTVSARPEAGEALVAGDVVNTAARLQGAAAVNGILVGEGTYRATLRAFDYRDHPPVVAKGKQRPVVAWEPLAARATLGVDVELHPRTPLVGRERELEQLHHAFERARAEREPQLVTVVGVPGIGKSRLLQELASGLEREPELIRWRQGRSLPYGEGVSYWALGEMFKAEAGILESDDDDVAEAKLREAVVAAGFAEDADWITSMVRPLVGIAGEVERNDRRTEAFSAWRRLLEGLADERPTVLVFEDLHWADDGLLDFADGLVEWATDVPLLVIATARPELLARRPSWGGGKPNAVTLSLTPLTATETVELVHAVLGRSLMEAEVQAEVLARADGNPLYAEEFARLIVDRGAVLDGELPMPDSLQGLIAARLDGLSRSEKELIQEAAVVGKVFWREALIGRGVDGPYVDEALRNLERKQFVRRERRSSIDGQEQFAFRHVLVRDVAYAQIPRVSRAECHERVARWMAAHARQDDAAELLAYHYVRALEYTRAGGRDVDELVQRAATALRDAGRRAVALNAFDNAVRFYEDALGLMSEDHPQWPSLALEHAEATVFVDLSGDRFLQRARPALTGDEAVRAEIALGEFQWLRGDREAAGTHFREAEQGARDMTELEGRLRVLANVGRFAALSDDYERAERIGRQSLELAEQLGRDEMRAHALNTIGIARVAAGDPGGIEDLEASRSVASRIRGPEYVRATGNLASVLGPEGQLRRAHQLHVDALEVANAIGYHEPTRWLRTEIAFDLEAAGTWDESLRMVDELIAGYAESPFWIEPQTRVCRARMLIARGEVDAAVADAARAIALGRQGGSFQSLCGPAAFRARLHLELGERDGAAAVIDHLLERWQETRSSYVDQWLLDAWYATCGTDREARLGEAIAAVPRKAWLEAVELMISRRFETAANRLDEMGAASCAALARLWGSEALAEDGRGREATRLLQPSLAFWRSVGATRYLRRGELLLAAAS